MAWALPRSLLALRIATSLRPPLDRAPDVAFIPSRRLAAEPGIASARQNVPRRCPADTSMVAYQRNYPFTRI
jgi:hypothetical protein